MDTGLARVEIELFIEIISPPPPSVPAPLGTGKSMFLLNVDRKPPVGVASVSTDGIYSLLLPSPVVRFRSYLRAS